MARLLHKGVYQEVVVDDYFPCCPRSGELLGAQPAGGNEIWVMILEKCWAKLFGSYNVIDGTDISMQVDCPTKSYTHFPPPQPITTA